MTTEADPVQAAVYAERLRAAKIVKRIIKPTTSDDANPVQQAVDRVIGRVLRECAQAILSGSAPPKVKRRRLTCSYCLGEREPEGHNRATCPERFEDITAGRVAS